LQKVYYFVGIIQSNVNSFGFIIVNKHVIGASKCKKVRVKGTRI